MITVVVALEDDSGLELFDVGTELVMAEVVTLKR